MDVDVGLVLSIAASVATAAGAVVAFVVGATLARRAAQLSKRSDSIRERMNLSDSLLDRLGAPGGEDASDLTSKVRFAAQLSTLAAEINEEIKAEFTLQIAEVERLQKQADDAKAIADLHEKAMEAAKTIVAGQMDQVLRRSKRGDRKWDIFLALGGAAIGIVATLVIQTLTGSA